MNAALFVKKLQVRQQGRLRELHRLWCWPQRSSHGQDQLGYRPCTLTRGPAPKSRQPLFYLAVFFVLILSPEIARRSSQKNEYRFQFISLSRGLKIFPPGRASDGGTRCPIQVATVATATPRRVGPAVAGRRSRLISAPSAIPPVIGASRSGILGGADPPVTDSGAGVAMGESWVSAYPGALERVAASMSQSR